MIISNSNERKGMILLVVIAFLAMFTVMGLTYILHADIQLKNSIDDVLALDMKEDPYKIIDLDPSVALDFFLEKFLYDQADSTTGGNAIRGQSLARNIYGGYVSGGYNDKAFSGIGKLNTDFAIAGSTIKEWQMVNYSFNGALNPERLNGGTPTVKTSMLTCCLKKILSVTYSNKAGQPTLMCWQRTIIVGLKRIQSFPNKKH